MMLGLKAPWNLEAVETDHAARRVLLRVVCMDTVWGDPVSRGRLHIHSWETRRWRHLTDCSAWTRCCTAPGARRRACSKTWVGMPRHWPHFSKPLPLVETPN